MIQDPRGICVQLNMCDEKNLERLSSNEILPSENVLAEEILEFIKTDICQKHGSLSSFVKYISIERETIVFYICSFFSFHSK